MLIALVVAVSRNGVIGRDGDLPWRVSADLKTFKQVTLGKPIIMGRKTWESLPRKPLPGRANIVMTRAGNYPAEGATIVATAEAALAAAEQESAEEACVIGGGDIYRQFMPLADRIYLSRVGADVEGDTLFPELAADEWKVVKREVLPFTEGDSARAELFVMDRKRPVQG